MAELVSAVGAHRYINARVPGGFRYGPAVPRIRGREGLDAPAILAVLARAEASALRHTPRGLFERGVARLLAGRVDQSIALLSLSVAAQPTADAWTALSAAYLEAAEIKDELATELSMRGLDAAEQALALNARMPEAWFNRALAATKLPPCDPGTVAWDEYIARESVREWRSEALRFRNGLAASCPNIGAENIPGHLRARVEEAFLPAWAHAWTEGRHADADVILREAEEVASTITNATGDPFSVQLVREVAAATGTVADRFALAWTHYSRSRELFDRSRDTEAAEEVRAANRIRLPTDAALPLLVRVQLATMAYQQQRTVSESAAQRVMDDGAARGYPGIVARARIVRSLVRMRLGRLSDAAEDSRATGETLERLQEPDLAAASYSTLATIMRSLNDARGTWHALAKTLHLVDRVQGARRRYVLLYNASLVAEGAGVRRAALRYQSAAVHVAEERGVAGTIVEAYTRRAELREQLQRGSGASDLQVARRRLAEVADEGRARYYSALIDAVDAQSLLATEPAAARERFGRALDFFGEYDPTQIPRLRLGRGRASRSIGDVEGARRDFLAGITAFEAGRLRVSADNRVAYFDAARELFDEMVASSDPLAAFAFAERGRALTVVEALGGPVETAPGRVAAQLPRATALVQYASLPDRVMIWVLTRNGTETATVSEPRASLEQRVLSLLAAVADEQGTRDVTMQAEELYRLLVRPVERHLGDARHLVIVGDGPVHRVPFALLRSDGKHLVERFQIVNALSASAFLAAERNGNGAPDINGVVAVGNPAYDRQLFEGLRPLPSAEREAVAIAAMYPRGTLLTRREATREKFLGAAAASSVIHFGGHAVIDAEAPDRSALLLATGDPTGSTLSAPEIARLRFERAPVVVLAACSTATGAAYRMEGATSLSRAFLLAGASNVVGSLWDIDDQVSEAFFVRFHRRLAGGDTPAAALRAAQIELLRAGDPRLRAPRAWAAFQLIGALSRPSA
jgi:CHAT domain-containing protein